MSLLSSVIGPVPEQTARIARAAFPKGNLYLKLRDDLGTLFDDRDFADMFARRGHPSYAPWRLALITVMQFLENLSDQQAAETVAGLFKIHKREFDGYKTPLYPLTPLFFLFVTALVLLMIAMRKPFQSFLGIAVVLAGVPVYYLLFSKKLSSEI